jgi:hypothetical protein
MNISKNFLHAYFKRENPNYKKTIEALTSQISYISLPKEERKDYAVYSQALDPIFFNLSEGDLAMIESSLPPYQQILRYVYKKKGISEEDLTLSSKKISKFPFFSVLSHLKKDWKEIKEASERIKNKIITEEFEEILLDRSKKLSIGFRKLSIPIYSITTPLLYLKTSDPSLTAVWLSSSLLYYSLTYASYSVENKKVSNYLRKAATCYILAKNPVAFSQSMLEFGLGAPLAGSLIEKAWPYLPKSFRKAIDVSEKFLSGIKTKPFDEREIREELYGASKRIKTSLPNYILEEFRDKIENGSIKIENPRETLFTPFSLGYHQREIVLEKEGSKWKIVDGDYVRKLAQKEGKFLEDFEREITRRPWKYLSFDFKDRKPVYCKDVICMYYFKNDGLRRGVALKETEACLLGLYANELSRVYELLF